MRAPRSPRTLTSGLSLVLLLVAARATAQPKVLLLTGSVQQPWADDIKKKLESVNAFSLVDQVAGEKQAVTLQQLKGYGAVLVCDDGGGFGANATTTGDALADYHDQGGAVVTAAFVNASITLMGRFQTGGYLLIDPKGQESPMDSLGKIAEPNSPLVVGVAKFSCMACYRSTGGAVMGATVVASYGSGAPLIVRGKAKGKERVDLNFYPPSFDQRNDFWAGDGAVIMKNALLYAIAGGNPVQGKPNPVSFPDTGTGAQSAAIPVTFTNTGMAQQTVTALKVAGTHANEFLLAKAPQLPLALAMGASFTVEVAFAPGSNGARVASLQATVAGQPGSADVGLQGNGIGAKLTVTPNPINVGGSQIGQRISKDVTIANQGGGKITVQSAAITTNPQEFALANGPPFPVSLNGGASFLATIACTPQMNGNRTGTLTLTTNDAMAPTIAVPLLCAAGPPMISLDAGSIAFGNINLKAKSPEQIVTLTNGGFSNLNVTAITLGGANAGDFALDKKLAVAALPPGAAQPFGITFAPQQLGQRQATVTITSNDAMAPQKTIGLLGNGTSAMVTLAPLALDFGNQKVGVKSMPQNLTVTNAGSGTLKVMALMFSLPTYAQASGPMAPFTVMPNSNTVLGIQCQPAMVGPLPGMLTVVTDVGQAQVALKCTGTAPKIALAPNAVDFGAVALGAKSMLAKITFSNPGTDDLVVDGMAIQGSDPGAFGSPDLPAMALTLPPGKSASVSVQYAPQAAAQESAELFFTSNDPLLPMGKVALTGRGFMAGASVDTNTLNFGAVLVGEVSPPKSFKLTNTGAAPQAMTIDPPTNAAYALDPKAPLLLAPQQSAAIKVTFSPAAVGAAPATVTVLPMGLPAIKITLTGSGVGPQIGVSPAAVDFGPIAIGERSEAVTVGIKNGSASTIQIGAIAVGNPGFVVDTSGTTLALSAGGITTFTVTFAPQAAGTLMASVGITLKGQSSPAAQVQLVGVGAMARRPAGRGCAVATGASSRGTPAWLGAGLALLALALTRRPIVSRRRGSV